MCRHSGVTRLCKSASVSYGKRRHGVRRGRRTISRPIDDPSLPLRDGVCSGSDCSNVGDFHAARRPWSICAGHQRQSSGGRPKLPDGLRTRLADLSFLAVERLGELLDSADERVRPEAAKTILDRHLGRPAIQADISLHQAEAGGHLAALLQVARRRALEPILLEDVEVEVTSGDPSPRSR